MTLGTTVGSLIERTRREALLASRGPVYTVGAAYTAGATSLTLTETPTHIGVGSTLSIDFEIFYVQAVNSGTKTVTVIPGYFGTTQANHSQNAVIEVDPRFPKASLLDHAQQEIMSWGTELWRTSSVNIDIDSNHRTYDLTGVSGEVYFLLDVRQQPLGTDTQFWNFSWTMDSWAHLEAHLARSMDTANFPSGIALQLLNRPTHASPARVTVAQPLDVSPFADTTDLVSDVGLRTEWFDILELGTKSRVLASTVIGRSDWRVSNMARAVEEVSALDTVRAVQSFTQLRDLRFAKAASDLRSEFPFRGV